MALATDAERKLLSENGDFIANLRKRVHQGDPDIPVTDFERYEKLVSTTAMGYLLDKWAQRKEKRKVLDLIAECTREPPYPNEGALAMQHRTNRLLAAILEKLHAGD